MTSNYDFKSISDAARDALLSDPFFSTIVIPGLTVPFIISEDPNRVSEVVQRALANVNFAVVCLLPICRVQNPNEPGPYFDDVVFHVKCFELPNVNRAQPGNNPSCYDIAANVCRILHLYSPNDIDRIFFVTEAIPVADPDLIIYQIGIKCATGFGFTGNVTQIGSVVATPSTPSSSPQYITLKCSTLGAAIFYTLDGTYPSPFNPTSIFYAPVQPLLAENGEALLTEAGTPLYADSSIIVQPGTIFRARAWLSGYSPANPPEIYIQY
jgi:hypothetical protein